MGLSIQGVIDSRFGKQVCQRGVPLAKGCRPGHQGRGQGRGSAAAGGSRGFLKDIRHGTGLRRVGVSGEAKQPARKHAAEATARRRGGLSRANGPPVIRFALSAPTMSSEAGALWPHQEARRTLCRSFVYRSRLSARPACHRLHPPVPSGAEHAQPQAALHISIRLWSGFADPAGARRYGTGCRCFGGCIFVDLLWCRHALDCSPRPGAVKSRFPSRWMNCRPVRPAPHRLAA